MSLQLLITTRMGKKEKLRGKDLLQIGYTDTAIRSMALIAVAKAYRYSSKTEKLEILQKLINNPKAYQTDEGLGSIAIKLLDTASMAKEQVYTFEKKPYETF